MFRYLVIFKSHAEELTDVHYVKISAPSPLRAVRDALEACPPPHDWVFAHATLWPRSARCIDQAIMKLTGTRM